MVLRQANEIDEVDFVQFPAFKDDLWLIDSRINGHQILNYPPLWQRRDLSHQWRNWFHFVLLWWSCCQLGRQESSVDIDYNGRNWPSIRRSQVSCWVFSREYSNTSSIYWYSHHWINLVLGYSNVSRWKSLLHITPPICTFSDSELQNDPGGWKYWYCDILLVYHLQTIITLMRQIQKERALPSSYSLPDDQSDNNGHKDAGDNDF